MKSYKNFISDVYKYYSALGLNPRYATQSRKRREAAMLKTIYNIAPDKYDEIIKYGITHKKPISQLVNKVPEIVAEMNKKKRAEWEFSEGYKYVGEEKERKFQEWLNELSSKKE